MQISQIQGMQYQDKVGQVYARSVTNPRQDKSR